MLYLCIIAALLACADGYLTWKGIADGTAKEANPVLRWIMDKIGLIPALVVSRFVVFGALLYEPKTAYFLAPVFALAVVLNLRNVKL